MKYRHLLGNVLKKRGLGDESAFTHKKTSQTPIQIALGAPASHDSQ
jgi:hypothetical protein